MHLAAKVLTVDQVAKKQAAELEKQRQADLEKRQQAAALKKQRQAAKKADVDWNKWILYGALGVVGLAVLKSMMGGKS